MIKTIICPNCGKPEKQGTNTTQEAIKFCSTCTMKRMMKYDRSLVPQQEETINTEVVEKKKITRKAKLKICKKCGKEFKRGSRHQELCRDCLKENKYSE